MHGAAAFSLTPGLTDITIFGGSPDVPIDYQVDEQLTPLAKTTVLRFGKSIHCVGTFTIHRAVKV